MDNLMQKVEELEKMTDEGEIVKQLQEIGEIILTQYVVKVDNIIVEPLWVEAYYFNKNNFPDCNTHQRDKQKNRFNKAYFHEEGRGGFDVCLSLNNNYYLSFLFKYTLIDLQDGSEKKFKKQTEIYDSIGKTEEEIKDIENLENIMKPRNKECQIAYTERVGLTKGCFKGEKLALFCVEDIRKHIKIIDQSTKDKIALVAEEYIKNYKESHSIDECKLECKNKFGYIPDNVRKLFN